RLVERLQREVQLPSARDKSRLLPLLPDSTFVYVALPNYGEASHQSLAIFRDELAHSAVLRDWWQHTASDAPQLETHIEQFYMVSQYLGDEIVLSGAAENGKDPRGLFVAEVRKPGLKLLLQGLAKKLAADSKLNLRILDDAALGTATDAHP